MPSPLDMSVDELLERVEAAAASGDGRAERVLALLLEEEARTGGLGVIARLSARPYVQPAAEFFSRRGALVPAVDADQKSGLPLGAHDEGDQHG